MEADSLNASLRAVRVRVRGWLEHTNLLESFRNPLRRIAPVRSCLLQRSSISLWQMVEYGRVEKARLTG